MYFSFELIPATFMKVFVWDVNKIPGIFCERLFQINSLRVYYELRMQWNTFLSFR